MPTAAYRTRLSGKDTLGTAATSSAGASSAGQIPALNASGLIDSTMLPVSNTGNVQCNDTAASAISAGNLINFGPSGVRPADSTSGYPADGFAAAAVASGASGTFSLIGVIGGLSGLTKGTDYYLGTNGALIPAASGSVIQRVGKALSTTELDFEYSEPTFIAKGSSVPNFLTRVNGVLKLTAIAAADITAALATPPPIGGTTPAAGSFSTLTSSSQAVLQGLGLPGGFTDSGGSQHPGFYFSDERHRQQLWSFARHRHRHELRDSHLLGRERDDAERWREDVGLRERCDHSDRFGFCGFSHCFRWRQLRRKGQLCRWHHRNGCSECQHQLTGGRVPFRHCDQDGSVHGDYDRPHLMANAASAAFIITLPASPLSGQVLRIKKIDSSTNVVTIASNGKNIDGAASASLSAQFAVLRLQYDGTTWWVF